MDRPFRMGQRVVINVPKRYVNRIGVVDDLVNDKELVHVQLLNKHGQSQGGYFIARKYVKPERRAR